MGISAKVNGVRFPRTTQSEADRHGRCRIMEGLIDNARVAGGGARIGVTEQVLKGVLSIRRGLTFSRPARVRASRSSSSLVLAVIPEH